MKPPALQAVVDGWPDCITFSVEPVYADNCSGRALPCQPRRSNIRLPPETIAVEGGAMLNLILALLVLFCAAVIAFKYYKYLRAQ